MNKTSSEHESGAPSNIGFGVVTISDSRYKVLKEEGDAKDISGKLILDGLREGGHRVIDYAILPDDEKQIEQKIASMVSKGEIDVIICSGGTGITKRDVTIEALEGLFDKRIDGFGELFRKMSFEKIGMSVMLTRATAGVSDGVLIFALPGSPDAVKTGMEIILKEVRHLAKHAKE
ncbi:MAG: molybdenum cofactor biosynthesis protein B [Candidatus Hydrothermarchaeales archaeon]